MLQFKNELLCYFISKFRVAVHFSLLVPISLFILKTIAPDLFTDHSCSFNLGTTPWPIAEYGAMNEGGHQLA